MARRKLESKLIKKSDSKEKIYLLLDISNTIILQNQVQYINIMEIIYFI